MSEINTAYDKAILMMEQALLKYKEGQIDIAEKDRELANKYFDEAFAQNDVNTENEENDILYGESRNFGIMYKVLESNLTKSLQDKSINRKPIIEALKKIKENKILNEEFKAFNAFCNISNITNVNDYVNEVLNILPKFNKKQLRLVNESLINFIQDNKINQLIDISDDELNLYESINFVITNNKKLNTVNEFIVHKNNIIDYINNHKVIVEKVDIDNQLDDELSSLEEKYDDILSDDEKLFITEMLSNESKEEYFNENKKMLLSLINEQIDSSNNNNKEHWLTLKQKISESLYNEENFIVDIAKIIEIQNKLTH